MEAHDSFQQLIGAVRAGDAEAAAKLVRHYEPEIRRIVRVRLSDPRLARLLDSMDICQSVLGGFFVRAAAGQFELENPTQLLKLLLAMARNSIRDKARRQHAQRRDNRLQAADGDEILEGVAAAGATPSQIVANRELLEKVRNHLTEDERWLANQRALGRDWPELAAETGENADALRKRLRRGLDRVIAELGLEGSSAG